MTKTKHNPKHSKDKTLIKVESMFIRYNPVEEFEGIYLSGGDYTLELHTKEGIFYKKVQK